MRDSTRYHQLLGLSRLRHFEWRLIVTQIIAIKDLIVFLSLIVTFPLGS